MKKLLLADHAEGLIEKGYITEHEMGNKQKYYNLTKEGKKIDGVNYQPASGGERGSESFEHRFGVRVTATYLEQQGYDVTLYYDTDTPDDDDSDADIDGDTYDIYAFDTPESPDVHRKVVEIETSQDIAPHVKKDYQKLAEAYGDPIWVVEKFDDAIELVNQLVDEDCLSDDINRSVRNFDDLNDQLDADGMSKILGMKELKNKI